MNKSTRTFKSIRNITYGIATQFFTTFLKFISRTIFIKILGAEYLGINGLFANILSILSLAELGFGQAIIYDMYKPIAEKNEKKIAALINFYRTVYDIIAVSIFAIGMLLIPFLQYIVNTTMDLPSLIKYYILFLLSTVISYVFSYKTSILNADQKQYKLSLYSIIVSTIQFVAQIIVLVLMRNYVFYLVTQILISLINNIVIAAKVNNMYPYINSNEKIDKNEREKIYSNVFSLSIYKTSGVLLNNTDNILISTIVNTICVGIYSNYLMIINMLNSFLSTIFYSTSASVGNFNTEEDSARQHELYQFMNLFAGYIYGVCSLILILVFNDFIELWVGKEYLFNMAVVIVIVANFYIPGMLTPSWIFRNTTGLFKKTRYLSLITVSINLILSVVLGKAYGIFGILLATTISRLTTNFWYEPYVLYKYIFKTKMKNYWKRYIIFIAIYLISYVLTRFITMPMSKINLINIVIKAIISFAITSTLFLLTFIKDKNIRSLLKKLKNSIIKIWVILKYENYKNFCRKNNQKEFLMFNTPLHGNIGDQAIIYAEKEFFKHLKLRFFEIPTYQKEYYFDYIKSHLSPQAIICVHGGGFIGSQWTNEMEFANQVISEFAEHKIIIFPQTIFFKDDENGRQEMNKSKEIFGKARELNIFTREKNSFILAQKLYPKARIFLVPDIVLSLDKIKWKYDRKGILLCMRSDPEGIFSEKQKEKIRYILGKYGMDVMITDMVENHMINSNKRKKVIYKKLKKFAKSKIVITDRLHGMIFAYLTQTPCIVFSNYNHKVKGVYDWLKSNTNTIIYETEIENLENGIDKLLNIKEEGKTKQSKFDFTSLSKKISKF